MILDFQSAFFVVPLSPKERGYFVIKHEGKFYIFLVMAQSGALFPCIRARVAGLLGRLVQALFDRDEVSINTFVDGPLAVRAGPQARRNRHMAMIIIAWRVLGFPLSFHKGKAATTITWTGTTYELLDRSVVCTARMRSCPISANRSQTCLRQATCATPRP